MQKALVQLKQIYFVEAKQEPHIAFSAAAIILLKLPLVFSAHVKLGKTVELWVKYNLT